jgi:hypothetical protein
MDLHLNVKLKYFYKYTLSVAAYRQAFTHWYVNWAQMNLYFTYLIKLNLIDLLVYSRNVGPVAQSV